MVDRERALQREERQQSRPARRRLPSAAHWRDLGGEEEDASVGLSGSGKGRGKGETLFRLLVQANDGEEGEEGRVVSRGRRLEMGELLGNAFIFLLAGNE